MVKIKRIYDLPSKDDGKRIPVDRLWPRGLSKEAAEIDERKKEIAPSDELRKRADMPPPDGKNSGINIKMSFAQNEKL
jgi:uncharacterized protein YeaO (DUF488 family)